MADDARAAPDSAVMGHLLATLAWLVEQGEVDGETLHRGLQSTAADGDLTSDEGWDDWFRRQAYRADQRVRAAVLDRDEPGEVRWVGGPLEPPGGDATLPTT